MLRIRHLALLVALGILLVACGGADVQGAPVVPVPTGDVTTASTSSPDAVLPDPSPTDTNGGSNTTTEVAGPSGVDGPAAPDFSLLVDDGSTFVLSQETRPVYLVFWAEW
ncbi:MAG: hypothetical protein OEO77_11450 [Acidimicrobiia bacterium]|nr:hypothetical protein [Acidimicrobiia bacterium]